MNIMDSSAFLSTQDILTYLKNNSEEKYRDFSSSLIPTIPKQKVLGVRTPVLRALAKQLKDNEIKEQFLRNLPHTYLEENHLHGFLIETEKDFDKALALITQFLPYIDNWATCDCTRPKVFKKHLSQLYPHIRQWLDSDDTYTVRYAIGLLLSFYLDDEFQKEHLILVSKIKSDEYYINMMIAWYFATALFKQYDITVPYYRKQGAVPFHSQQNHTKSVRKPAYQRRYKSLSSHTQDT